jgi:Domain of unknown function (DUF4349)
MTMFATTLSHRTVWIMLSVLALAACSREPSRKVSATLSFATVSPQTAAGAEQRPKEKNLAYEHTVSIALDRAKLGNRMREIQVACASDKEFGCTLLDVSQRSDVDFPSGTIRMRLAPAGVEVFTASASKNGTVTDSLTHAEDLTEKVTDTEREVTLLTTHRDRLSAFLKDKSLKVDQVIAVSKELASVQTELETAATTRANLSRRIDTELLTLKLSVPVDIMSIEPTPIQAAMSSFAANFTDAIAQVIRFIAAVIPWLVVIVPGIILVRLFWRAIGRWLARRERAA